MQDECTTGYGLCECGCGERTTISDKTDRKWGWVKDKPKRFVQGHGSRRGPVDYLEEDRGYETPCWIWQRALDHNGYGRCGRAGHSSQLAHRVYYEVHVGPIPTHLQIDHLCRVPACVNPAHLEPATNAENSRRRPSLFTADDARAICASSETNSALAKHYGTSRDYIGQIRAGRCWAEETNNTRNSRKEANAKLSDETLTVREAARRLAVHENTIRNYMNRGLLSPVRLPSGIRRIPCDQIQRMRDEMWSQFAPATEMPAQRRVPHSRVAIVNGEVLP